MHRAGVRWAARGETGPSRGRACQPQPPPAPPAPLSALRAAPSRPQGVQALRGRARRRVGEELGGSGRAAKLRGGSLSAPAEEPLGDPRCNSCAAAAPGRAGDSPLARADAALSPGACNYRVCTARQGSAAKRMGGPREGRGGARPATSNPGRAPSSSEKSDLGLGRVRSQAGEKELGKAGRQEREHCWGSEYSGSSPKAGNPDAFCLPPNLELSHFPLTATVVTFSSDWWKKWPSIHFHSTPKTSNTAEADYPPGML